MNIKQRGRTRRRGWIEFYSPCLTASLTDTGLECETRGWDAAVAMATSPGLILWSVAWLGAQPPCGTRITDQLFENVSRLERHNVKVVIPAPLLARFRHFSSLFMSNPLRPPPSLSDRRVDSTRRCLCVCRRPPVGPPVMELAGAPSHLLAGRYITSEGAEGTGASGFLEVLLFKNDTSPVHKTHSIFRSRAHAHTRSPEIGLKAISFIPWKTIKMLLVYF